MARRRVFEPERPPFDKLRVPRAVSHNTSLLYLSAMPKPLLKEGFSFYFWSEEGSEPPHVHVSKGDGLAKWWLVPGIRVEYSNGFKKQEQRRIRELIEEHHETLLKAWESHFGARR